MGNVGSNDSIHISVAENGFVVTAWIDGGARTIIAGCEHELVDVILDLVVSGEESDEIESTN